MQRTLSLGFGAITSFLLISTFSSTALAATFTVDSTSDDAGAVGACTVVGVDCTLRAAVDAANNTAGTDVINFSLPANAIIPVSTNLIFTEAVTISNPLAGGQPQVHLQAEAARTQSHYLLRFSVGSEGSTISGLRFTSASAAALAQRPDGIRIYADNVSVSDCAFGFAADESSEGLRIGVYGLANTMVMNINVINSQFAASRVGAQIQTASNLVLDNNAFGTLPSGAVAGFESYALTLSGTGVTGGAITKNDFTNDLFHCAFLSNATNLTVGGSAADANTFRDCENTGIRIGGSNITFSHNQAYGNGSAAVLVERGAGHTLSDNVFGIAPLGAVSGNLRGIQYSNAEIQASITNNRIVGSSADGIYLHHVDSNSTVRDNILGILPDGTEAPNNQGIYHVRGTSLIQGNTIVSTAAAIRAAAGTTTIRSNVALSSQRGVYITGATQATVDDNLVVKTTADGIYVSSDLPVSLTANRIGENAMGVAGAPEDIGTRGIYLVKGTTDVFDNRISVTKNEGIRQNAGSSQLLRNTISDAGSIGILIQAGTSTIGDATLANGNTVSGSGTDGVIVNFGATASVRANSISGSGELGIDLNNDGVDFNDRLDADPGANTGLNYPVIDSVNKAAGMWTIEGFVGPNLFIDVYAADSDPNHPEGARYLGTVQEGSGGDLDPGQGSYLHNVLGGDTSSRFRIAVPAGAESGIVLTANDGAGNTSEFSPAQLLPTDGACGNGRRDTGEQCDDGNTFVGDGCDACQLEDWGCNAGPSVPQLWAVAAIPTGLGLYIVDRSNGNFTFVTRLPGYAGNLARQASTGDLIYIDGRSHTLYRWSPADGLERLAQMTPGTYSNAILGGDGSGRIYSMGNDAGTRYISRINLTDGTVTRILDVGTHNPADLVFNGEDDMFYAFGTGPDTAEVYRVPSDFSSTTLVNTITLSETPIDSNGIPITLATPNGATMTLGQTWYSFGTWNIFDIDIPGGTATRLDSNNVWSAGDLASCAVDCWDDSPGSVDSGCSQANQACTRDAGGELICVTCTAQEDCAGGLVCNPDNSGCVACTDTGGGVDLGCGGMTPNCDESGATPVCVACVGLADCDDGNPCTTDACNPATGCTNDPLATGADCGNGNICDNGMPPMCAPCYDSAGPGASDVGCNATSPICDTTAAGGNTCVGCTADDDCADGVCTDAQICTPCIDTVPGPLVDRGCEMRNAICDESGAMPACHPCVDDESGAQDLGCSALAPVCDSTGSERVCVACEDTITAGTDFGCTDALPACNPASSGGAACVQCLVSADCAGDLVCNPSNECTASCTDNSDCGGTTPICDMMAGACVACTDDSSCAGTLSCVDGACTAPDSDDDGIPDDVDIDDDNDGIPDEAELGGIDPSLDSNNNGILDFEDATVSTCDDNDGDDICDTLPVDVDFDQDGLANHLDLDADGDGITDIIEGGGTDEDQDGRVDDPLDANRDGLDDFVAATPLPLPNSDDTDGADFLDLDADGDGVDDASEGHDTDHDGEPDTAPSGADTDQDGIDDAFDIDCASATECAGIIGTPAPTPDLDEDGTPNFQDADDDNDTMPTAEEVADGAIHGNDPDADGLPNWYDTDSDGDTAPDMSELMPDNNDDGIPERLDLDEDGVPDYLDPDSAPTDSDGDGLPDVFECPEEPCRDSDMDGLTDPFDDDDDNDGIPTMTEVMDGGGVIDTDEDGLPNYRDIDSDGDGITDGVECGETPCTTSDSDDSPDYLDTDADNDGILDSVEGHDADFNGIPDTEPSMMDANMNGLDDAYDAEQGGTMAPVPDLDMDGTPNYQDIDDDNDGIHTVFEGADPNGDGRADDATDTDEDGRPNYLDDDDDNDGTPTADENGDPNGDGDPSDAVDGDGDDIPDYLDPDGGTVTPSGSDGLSGGALCAASPTQNHTPWWALMTGLAVIWRRRR